MSIELSDHDDKLVQQVFTEIQKAFENAQNPSTVVKKIVARAMRYRNKGRTTAMRRYPFKGICEASGLPIERSDAHLDELTPKGYAGDIRWVCPKANNSGTRSCGGC